MIMCSTDAAADTAAVDDGRGDSVQLALEAPAKPLLLMGPGDTPGSFTVAGSDVLRSRALLLMCSAVLGLQVFQCIEIVAFLTWTVSCQLCNGSFCRRRNKADGKEKQTGDQGHVVLASMRRGAHD